ncbi:MAG: exonuclease SbcCD subunit D [Candidatus Aenigmarchaeota archaeon]|nr:exonuclease SbcCD subunit D [Candidatus Aenigmarchaeota archaeon]
MRFAHFSDCHLGSWNNHPELRELSMKTFEASIDSCISENVDFILISGDLFDTSLPPIDILRRAVTKFRHCKEAGISVYAIPGSHDFSPTGKTFLNVLEEAGLLKNVARYSEDNGKIKLLFTEDKKTGAKIAGIEGKMGALEKSFFERLESTEKGGFKIFMFHSAIEEFRPAHMKDMKAVSLKHLPKNFDYYAAGHVHVIFESDFGKGKIVFPGTTFPTEFTELESYDAGFYIVDTSPFSAEKALAEKEKYPINARHKSIRLCGIAKIRTDGTGKSSRQVEEEIREGIDRIDLKNKILLLRAEGVMDGNPNDIDFRSVFARAYEKGAISVKKNVSRLVSKEMEEIEVTANIVVGEMEKELIRKHMGSIKISFGDEEQLTESLMEILKEEKQEGETNYTFEERLKANGKKILGLDL